MTDKEKAADKRLQRVFGRTLEWYNEELARQNGLCKICRRPPSTKRLACDHDHRWDRIKITVKKLESGEYLATGINLNDGSLHGMVATTRKLARQGLKLEFRKLSIRGLLCARCNRGLIYFRDLPERFESAAKYLRDYLEKTKC